MADNIFYWFSGDGSYGQYDDYHEVHNVDKWTFADWTEIENCTDGERTFVARGIANKYKEV
jgi:hypothetical protein